MSEITPPCRTVRDGSGRKRVGGVWSELLAELLAEFLGTFVVICFGDGVAALAVALGVYVAGGVSGAHLNPAVTLAFAVRGKSAWNKVIPYVIAQVVGAFAAVASLYVLYFNAIDAFNTAAKPSVTRLEVWQHSPFFPRSQLPISTAI